MLRAYPLYYLEHVCIGLEFPEPRRAMYGSVMAGTGLAILLKTSDVPCRGQLLGY